MAASRMLWRAADRRGGTISTEPSAASGPTSWCSWKYCLCAFVPETGPLLAISCADSVAVPVMPAGSTASHPTALTYTRARTHERGCANTRACVRACVRATSCGGRERIRHVGSHKHTCSIGEHAGFAAPSSAACDREQRIRVETHLLVCHDLQCMPKVSRRCSAR